MPALHDSVTYCRPCDLYVAMIEISHCFECGDPICPACALATDNPNAQTCSPKCRAIANAQIRKQDFPEAA